MIKLAPSSFRVKRNLVLLGGGVGIALGGMLAHIAIAAAPPANTTISNQATATYLDGNGVSQTATSNAVVTSVKQVGAYALSDGNTKAAGPGVTVAVPYTITNTGNGTDNFVVTVTENGANAFSRIDVFTDQADGDGRADDTTSLLTTGAITADSGTASTLGITIPAGQTYRFVVVYTVPASATTGWSNTAEVKVAPESYSASNPYEYVDASLTKTDTINLATSAAFNLTKSISAPAVAAVGGGGWGPTPSSGEVLTETVYTLTYTNNGAEAGKLYLKDVLPEKMEYQTGTAVWSSAPGVAQTDASGDTSGNIEYQYDAVAHTVEAVIANVAPGVTGTLSFKVKVAADAPMGTSKTTGSATYGLNCTASTITLANGGTGCGPDGTSTTAAVSFTVLPTYAVEMGALDSTPGTPNVSGDLFTPTPSNIVPGGSASITIPVKNTGNAPETFKLSTAAATGTAFPTGTTFTWFAADGATPLQNTAGGVGVDTGPVAAGDTVNVVLKITIPITTDVANGVNYQVKAVATSFGKPTVLDAAIAQVDNVIGGLVDLTATATGTVDDSGPGTATVIQNLTVTAGASGTSTAAAPDAAKGTAVYDLFVKNASADNLTFNLQVSQTASFPGNPPAGWTVKFYSDAGLTTEITTVAVTASSQEHVYAAVTPNAGATSVTDQSLYFRVISTTAVTGGGVVSDYLHNKITVTAASSRSFTLAAAGNGQVTAAGSTTFAHVITNTGSLSCGSTSGLTVSATLDSAAVTAGWTATLFDDVGTTVGAIDSGDTVIGDGSSGNIGVLATGTNRPILVRVVSPGGATAGNTATVTITTTDSDPTPNCGTQTIDNVAIVITGNIGVVKYQRLDTACTNTTSASSSANITARPGECIVYKVVATNNGAAPVTNVKLWDVVPPYTTWSTNQPTSQCASSAGSPTLVPGTVSGSSVTCGEISTLPPSGDITLEYAVKVAD
ncbi:beta strand repeat-containing protein [Thauera sinica]|uniref:DUF11 domain-containing protein n=1 Tax=Thauera sinica TaxID=2665146 RepID=A0ABW1AR84_9RHOO|nr:DUF11 domain-containing protein [Thauera sp. K11]ATE60106.1 hypothetical protein CCZ27_09215 [Thauera sp. K11]